MKKELQNTTIRITKTLHRKLLILAGKKQIKIGKRVTTIEIIEDLLKKEKE